MFTLTNFNPPKSRDVTQVVNEDLSRGDIDRLSFDPYLCRPYRARARRPVGNGRYAEYGPERVWVDVFQEQREVRDSYNQPVRNEQGELLYETVRVPQVAIDRRNRDLPVFNGLLNNATTLRKDQWIRMDQALLGIQRKRLRLWTKMRAMRTIGGFDGMASTLYQWERLVDAGEALVSMSPKDRGNNYNPHYELEQTPLPITFCDFDIDARTLAVSRANGGQSLEVTKGEFAARRCAEAVEQQALGTFGAFAYGDTTGIASGNSAVYGLTNHPDRITKTDLTAASGISGANWYANVTAMVVLAEAQNMFGPFELFVSSSYDQESRDDYTAQYAKSTKARTMELDEIRDITRLDYLSGDVMILVADDGDVAAINGMEFVTVQRATTDWEELSFKRMGIQVPLVRSKNVNTETTGPAQSATAKAPVVHGTTS